jgi:hypothetical protein
MDELLEHVLTEMPKLGSLTATTTVAPPKPPAAPPAA